MTEAMKRAYRCLCMLLVGILALSPATALADQNDDATGETGYTQEQIDAIADNYFYQAVGLKSSLESDTIFGYWQMVHGNSESLSALIDVSSWMLDVYPDREDYVRILSALMTIMSGDYAEQVGSQAQFDDLKSDWEYMHDAVSIITDLGDDTFAGLNAFMNGIDDAENVTGFLKYYVACLGDYTQTRQFLDAIVTYADDDMLKDTAEKLKSSADALLQERLAQFEDATDTLPEYDADYFNQHYSYAMLNAIDAYDVNSATRTVAGYASDLISQMSSTYGAATLSFKMAMLIGDFAFGTTNTFDRYQEMRVMADIADALVQANDAIDVPATASNESLIPNIRVKCRYYQALIAVHGRGEYLRYSLVTKDAGEMSKSRGNTADDMSGPTAESQYKKTNQILQTYDAIVKSIFDVDEYGTQDDVADSTNDNSAADSETANDDADMDITFDDDWQSDDPQVDSSQSGEIDVVLVLDVSGSMDGEPLQQTKQAASQFVATEFEKDTRIGIVTYDSQAELASPFNRDDACLNDAIDELSAGSNTNIKAGLTQARTLLASSSANKRIIVLMSDGQPNEGLTGAELIGYADSIRDQNIRMYTLGFNEDANGQALLAGIADEGRHYEVQDADDLAGFFVDIADEIDGTRFVYVKAACPIDITVNYDGETLTSAGGEPVTRTSFGTLTFEAETDGDNATASGEDDTIAGEDDDPNQVKVLRLREGPAYDIEINGTGSGSMDYTIGFVDDAGEYNDFRTFSDIDITPDTMIDTTAEVADTTTLRVDDDGDGVVDRMYRAGANEEGQLIDNSWIAGVVLLVCVLIIAAIIAIIIKVSLNKKKRRTA